MKVSLSISDVGITLETGQQVWEAARELLRARGVVVTHPRLMGELKGRAGLTVDSERVRIAPELFESRYPSPMSKREQAESRPRKTKPAEGRYRLGCGGYSMDVVDWRTGEPRPATAADLAEACRVVDARGSRGPYCVTPRDVAPMLQDVVTYKTCFENSTGGVRGSYYSSPRQSPFIEEMCAVMGEPFRLLLGVVSPLKMSNSDLDNIYASVDAGKRHPVQLVGYGVPGIGSPAGLAASAALVMAENYGAAILLSLVFPENGIRAAVSAGGPTDFRHCNYAYGAPHTLVYAVVNAHLNAALAGTDPTNGVAIPSVSLHTGACLPDEQAAAEKASEALLGALLGARTFGAAGNLCVDDVFSLEQFIIDGEIVEHAVNTVDCCAPSALMADMASFADEMNSVLAGEDFLALPSTLDVMRAFYKPSAVFEHMKLRAWQGAGGREVRQKARERIKQGLAESDFELDPAKRRELGRIYAAAEKGLA